MKKIFSLKKTIGYWLLAIDFFSLPVWGGLGRGLLFAQTQTESFEGWDGSKEDWLPAGWTEKHSNQTWHVINPDNSTSLPNAYDGKYYVAVGYDKQNKAQDEWLFSPVYELSFYGGTLQYQPAYSPFWLYKVKSSSSIEYEEKDGKRVVAADLETWVRTIAADGTPGKWKKLRDLSSQWLLQDNETLFSAFFSTEFHSESSIFLTDEEYQGANVQIGFRYVGAQGNIIGLDKVQMSYATPTQIVPTNYDTPTTGEEEEEEKEEEEEEEDTTKVEYNDKTLTYHAPGADVKSTIDYGYGIAEVKSVYDNSVLNTFKGNRIVTMKGIIGPGCDSVKVMIRPSLYGDPLWEADVTEQYKTNYREGYGADFEVAVDSLEITGDTDEELWVCYKMYMPDYESFPDKDKDGYPDYPMTLYYLSPGYMPLTLVVQYDELASEVYDYSDEGPLYCVMETVGEGGVTPLDMSVDYIRMCRMTQNEDMTVQTEVTNHGAEPIEKAVITYRVDSKDYENTITFTPALKRMESRFVEGMICPTKLGRRTVTAKVVKVNGKDDMYGGNNSVDGTVFVLKEPYPRRLLVEQAVGSTLPPAARAYAGNAALMKEYPENIVSVDVHMDDEFYDESYWWVPYYYTTTYPVSIVNRYDVWDPIYGSSAFGEGDDLAILDEVKFLVDHKSEAEVKILSATRKDGSDDIDVEVQTTFCMGKTSAKYALTFIVEEDNLAGKQSNAYSKDAGNYESKDQLPVSLQYLWDLPKEYDTYYSVARYVEGSNGLSQGELPTTIKAGTPYIYTHTITLPETVKNKDNVYIIVGVMDVDETNEVVNCDRVRVSIADAIEAAEQQGAGRREQGAGSREQGAGEAYDLAGRKVQLGPLAPLAPSGLYITNGKKVFVR